MIKKHLLQQELEWYEERNIHMKALQYNENFISKTLPRLFNKFKYYGINENHFGLQDDWCDWQEIINTDIKNITLDIVKIMIENDIKNSKKYLLNTNRLYFYEDINNCYIYIYTRDIAKIDYALWFTNEEKQINQIQ
jgi:hypothetical protein